MRLFYLSRSGSQLTLTDSEEHRKRAVNKGQLCPFFAPKKPSAAALGRSTSRAPSSRLASKAPARTSPRTEKPRPVPEEEETSGVSSESDLTSLVFSTVKSKARSSARSKPSAGKSIATPASNEAPMSRRSTRGTGSNRRTPASQDAGSGLDERMDASGSETGKRVSKSKKGPLRGKKNITVIKEEEEEEAALDVDEEVEIVVKPKRGRPPGSKKTQAAASSGKGKKTPIEPPNVVDDSDMQPHPIPSKPANARTKSRTDTPPESSVPKSSSSKPSRSHTKTGTTSSSKSKSRIIVSSDEEADADLSSSGGGGGQQHVIRSGTTNNVPPQKFGPPKGRSASKAKAKTKGKAVESESEVERGLTVAKPKAIYVPIDTEENELGLRRLPNLKAKAGKSALKIVTPIQDEPRSKARKSSNTSDDAGYATAELAMEVEEDPPAPTVRLVTKASPIIDVPASPIHGDRDSGLAESIENSLPPARPNGSHASASKVASTTFRVSSAKRSGSVRPASQLGRRETTNKEIVDISSDEESSRPASAVLRNTVRTSSPIPTTDAPLPPSSSTSPLDVPFRDLAHSHATPASTHSATFNRLSSVPGTSSTNSKGKKKMVVEVVIPVSSGKRTSKSKQSLDVEMFDATGPKKQDPPNPRVPIDVDDDDDLHMNHVTSPPRTPTLSPVHPRAPSTPPMSRTNGRPIPSTSTEPTQTMSPGSFIPFLSQIPVQKLTFLTAEESSMTIEEYVRREIELQYQQLKKDAERRIEEFKIKAAKTRRILEDL